MDENRELGPARLLDWHSEKFSRHFSGAPDAWCMRKQVVVMVFDNTLSGFNPTACLCVVRGARVLESILVYGMLECMQRATRHHG